MLASYWFSVRIVSSYIIQMNDDRNERLQLQILKLVNDRGPSGVYKYNLTGRDATGELELSFRERWSTEERRLAAETFDDLKRRRLIQSTMTNSIDTDNWVTITQAGKEALAAGIIGTGGVQRTETQSRDLEEFVSAQLRLGKPVGVIFCDLDNFKTVNDTHHHEGGDLCIEAFRALARSIVEGRGELFRRYATGDEFIVVLPNCTMIEAAATAERIRRAVESSHIGQTVPVTVSLGVCSSADHAAKDAVGLIKVADGLMYRAGVLECWPAVTADGFSPQFWRAAPELKMFYVRKYEQDERDEYDTPSLAGSRFDLRNAIWRIGECVMHAARFNAALQLTSGVTGFRVAWTGLKNRQLVLGADTESFRCRQDTVESYTEEPVGGIESSLVEIVRSLLSPLCEAFDMYELKDESLRNELSRMLAECAGLRP